MLSFMIAERLREKLLLVFWFIYRLSTEKIKILKFLNKFLIK